MTPLLPLIAVAAAAFVGWKVLHRDSSSREDELPLDDSDGWQVVDSYLNGIRDSIGWPYWYAKGGPSTPWEEGEDGVDCSGYVQMVLVWLGLLSPDATDRKASQLADLCVPVAIGDQEPGDIAYYPGHVMIVASHPGSDGHSAVIGASGGYATTKGDDPNARIKVFDSALYRGDFVTYMRLPDGLA